MIADDGSCAASPLTICAALPMFTEYSRAAIDTGGSRSDFLWLDDP
jgi:hypothetical protein